MLQLMGTEPNGMGGLTTPHSFAAPSVPSFFAPTTAPFLNHCRVSFVGPNYYCCTFSLFYTVHLVHNALPMQKLVDEWTGPLPSLDYLMIK
jgi:hypothetical protein